MQAIQAALIGSFDIMILTENKITDHYYCCNSMGYNMVCSQETTTAVVDVQGRLGMLVLDQTQGWSIELTEFHGMDVLR